MTLHAVPDPALRAPSADRPLEILLTMAGYNGTLAAARSLGRRGLRVVVADADVLAPARWSRHVAKAVGCPRIETAPIRFLEWLLELGAREPGRLLCPTSDCTAWAFSRYRDDLARHFVVHLPKLSGVYRLLNKWQLHELCIELGIDAPKTWRPLGAGDLLRVEREATFPVVIKPQTQVLLHPHQKGRLVHHASDLSRLYREFVSATAHSPLLLGWDPGARHPIVQTFVRPPTGTTGGVYGLSGFIDSTGELFAVRASRKVLQWPPRLGVGLCFEAATVDERVASDVARLCRRAGYFGPFEVEFVLCDGRHQLIDFNPRFFGQMGFDIARGLDLPHLVYLAATQRTRELRRAVSEARVEPGATAVGIYCHRLDFEIDLWLRRRAGRISAAEVRALRSWLSSRDVVDAVLDRDDRWPGLADLAASVLLRAAHPRSTWRSANER